MRNKVSGGTIALPEALSELDRESARGTRHFACTSGPNHKNWFEIKNDASKAEDPAEVFIYDEIGFWGTDAQSFIDQFKQIVNPNITLHINSPGGDLFDGVAIYNAIRSHPSNVTVVVDGLAASAASFIAQAGDTVVMNPGTAMMIHDAATMSFGNAADMLKTAQLLDKVSNSVASLYALRAGEDTAFWRALMQEEVWYTAEEAVAANLADSVGTASPKKDAKTSNSWDLSIYNHKSREDAPSPADKRQLVLNKLKGTAVEPDEKPVEPVTEPVVEPVTEPVVEPVVEPATEPEPVVAPEPPAEPPVIPTQPVAPPENKAPAFTFIIDGKPESDPAKIQAYLTNRAAADKEARVVNRKAYIKTLCDDNKISAPQVAGLEELVLDENFTDAQYEKWVASWDAAPRLGFLAAKMEGVTNPNNKEGRVSAEQALEDAREIVRMHKRGNMPQAALEKAASYQLLKAAGQLDTI